MSTKLWKKVSWDDVLFNGLFLANVMLAIHLGGQGEILTLCLYWLVAWICTVSQEFLWHGFKNVAWITFVGLFVAMLTGFAVAAVGAITQKKDA